MRPTTPRSRRQELALTSAAGVLLLGASLICLNILSNWFFLRWDITLHHAYTLSSASKKIARSLDDLVVIKVYFTSDLPAPYNTNARYVKDLLAEYHASSKGRLRFEFVPNQPAKAFEDQAMEAGMTPLQFEQMASDQLQIKRGFMGLVLFYRDRTETVPVIKDIGNLEYELTSRLVRMARKNKKMILVSSGHGEANWLASQFKAAQDLGQLYDLQTTMLPPGTTTPLAADALLIAGPQEKFDDKSLWTVDQMIMRGIPAAILLDSHRFQPQQFMVFPQTTGLQDLLAHYGLRFGKRLVYDAQCETVGMMQNIAGFQLPFSVHYPYIPLVTRFEKSHPVLWGIETIGLPFSTSLEPAPPPGGVRFAPLFYSSDQSWLAPENTYSVAPGRTPVPPPDEPHGPYLLGGLLEGIFPSYFADKKPPVPGAAAIPKSPKTAIFVLGTSRLLDPNLPEFPGAGALMTNVLAYLSHDDALLGINAKGEILRPLKPVAAPIRQLVKVACLLGLPAAPMIWGLYRWRRRESWRKSLTADLASA